MSEERELDIAAEREEWKKYPASAEKMTALSYLRDLEVMRRNLARISEEREMLFKKLADKRAGDIRMISIIKGHSIFEASLIYDRFAAVSVPDPIEKGAKS